MSDRYGFNPGYGLFPSGGGGQGGLFPSQGPSGNISLFPSTPTAGGYSLFPEVTGGGQGGLFPTEYSGGFDTSGNMGADPSADFQTNEEATIAAGGPPLVASGGWAELGPGTAEIAGKTRTFDAKTWQAAGQWDDELLAAAAAYGVPANRLKAQMMIESGGEWVGPDGKIITQHNPYNGDSYGLMQIVVTAAPGVCGPSWCGWGDGKAETKSTGINHNVMTPDGNIMMGARILSEFYHEAKQLYPDLTEDQLWDMASSSFFVGNMQWDGQDSINGNSGGAYKQDMDTLIATMGQATGQAPGQHPGSMEGPPELINQHTGDVLVDAALDFLGTNYVWGAPYGGGGAPGEPTYFDQSGRPTAFDCSGLVAYLANTYLGMHVSGGSHEQYADPNFGHWVMDGPLQPGDVMFFNTGTSQRAGNQASHVGIFLGYDAQGVPWMINALNETEGVVATPLNDEYWTTAYMGSKRLAG